jgi:PIN domain nuclease of toxin-antitoxin system
MSTGWICVSIKPGDEVLLRLENGEVRVSSRAQARRRAQEYVQSLDPKNVSLAAELIKERAMRQMISCVLGASAVLAYLHGESGSAEVAKLLDGAAVSALNVAEVAGKLAEIGAPRAQVQQTIEELGMEIIACDAPIAYRIGELRTSARRLGLSLVDRACLSTAIHCGVRAVTADRHWKRLTAGAKIHVIR